MVMKKIIKKFLTTIIAMSIIYMTPVIAMADSDITCQNQNGALIEAFDSAMEQLKDIEVKPGEIIRIQVNEDYILEAGVEELPTTRSSFYKNIHAWVNMKNSLGAVGGTLHAYSQFLCNGSTSKPLDIYGGYELGALGYCDDIQTQKGPEIYNAYTRITFYGHVSFNGITLESRTYSCRTYCNANGEYTTSWNRDN